MSAAGKARVLTFLRARPIATAARYRAGRAFGLKIHECVFACGVDRTPAVGIYLVAWNSLHLSHVIPSCSARSEAAKDAGTRHTPRTSAGECTLTHQAGPTAFNLLTLTLAAGDSQHVVARAVPVQARRQGVVACPSDVIQVGALACGMRPWTGRECEPREWQERRRIGGSGVLCSPQALDVLMRGLPGPLLAGRGVWGNFAPLLPSLAAGRSPGDLGPGGRAMSVAAPKQKDGLGGSEDGASLPQAAQRMQDQALVKVPSVSVQAAVAAAHKEEAAKDGSMRARISRGWKHFKEEMYHYWLGTKLLGKEVGVCYGIIKQITRGEELTRREYRQLRTTSADLMKMIPMAIFILVPFMEFALPVALYLFPVQWLMQARIGSKQGLRHLRTPETHVRAHTHTSQGILPSTFKHEWKKEDEMKRSLKARIEVARFLQDAMNDMAHQVVKKYPTKPASVSEGVGAGGGETATESPHATAAEFSQFMKRVQMGDARVTNAEILKFCKLFSDDITLDNVGRLQLVNLCRLLDIPVVGPDSFLKYRLIERMRNIRADDRMIQAEGLEALNYYELREALSYRGMRSVGLTRSAYKEELKSWLDLHLNKNVPTTLLLMSRAFKITQTQATEEAAIKDTLQAMPHEAMKSAESMAVESNKVAEKLKRLDELQREQALIEQERIERLEMLAADLHSSAGRFIDNHGLKWLRDHLDLGAVQIELARKTRQALEHAGPPAEAAPGGDGAAVGAGGAGGAGGAAAGTGAAGGDVALVDKTEGGEGQEPALKALLRSRVEAVEADLLGFVQVSLLAQCVCVYVCMYLCPYICISIYTYLCICRSRCRRGLPWSTSRPSSMRLLFGRSWRRGARGCSPASCRRRPRLTPSRPHTRCRLRARGWSRSRPTGRAGRAMPRCSTHRRSRSRQWRGEAPCMVVMRWARRAGTRRRKRRPSTRSCWTTVFLMKLLKW